MTPPTLRKFPKFPFIYPLSQKTRRKNNSFVALSPADSCSQATVQCILAPSSQPLLQLQDTPWTLTRTCPPPHRPSNLGLHLPRTALHPDSTHLSPPCLSTLPRFIKSRLLSEAIARSTLSSHLECGFPDGGQTAKKWLRRKNSYDGLRVRAKARPPHTVRLATNLHHTARSLAAAASPGHARPHRRKEIRTVGRNDRKAYFMHRMLSQCALA